MIKIYMGMEPAGQGEICRTLGEIVRKWDKISIGLGSLAIRAVSFHVNKTLAATIFLNSFLG